MFWLHCGLFVLVIAVSGFISSLADTTKRGNACLPAYPSACLPACLPAYLRLSLLSPRLLQLVAVSMARTYEWMYNRPEEII